MIRPDNDVLQQLARISGTYPEVLRWLNDWRMRELEQLPNVASTVVGVAQGRCQVLTELCKLVNTARDLSAQSRK